MSTEPHQALTQKNAQKHSKNSPFFSNCLSVLDYFVGLALKRLRVTNADGMLKMCMARQGCTRDKFRTLPNIYDAALLLKCFTILIFWSWALNTSLCKKKKKKIALKIQPGQDNHVSKCSIYLRDHPHSTYTKQQFSVIQTFLTL